jgi:ankyrin repeat domain-containing protein 50
MEEQKESAQKAKKLGLLKQLYTSPYRECKDRNPERVDGTCEWFTNHPLFQSWHESKTSSLLWVSADPGCGKSVLAKYLVDAVLPSTKSRTTCYFFFKDDFEDQRNAASALCCILHQLFSQKEHLFGDEILEGFEAYGEKLTQSFIELWDILISATKGQDAGEIICIVDALDECEDKGRSQLINALSNFYKTRATNSILKFLLTSRPYVHIQREFQSLKNRFPTIHLSGEDEVEVKKISQEINVFIKSRVVDIGANLQLLPGEQQLLLDELLRVPSRTYLWVHLTLDVIRNSVNITRGSIHADTSKIPKNVDEAYDKILCRSRDFEKARRLLHIVIASTRPLSLKEMALALAIKENHQSYSDLELELEGRFRNTVRDLCGLFVTIIDSKIYLLHQTAKEFLVQNVSLDLANPPNHSDGHLQWKFSLWPGDSNRILAEICIWHLLFREFQTYPLGANGGSAKYIDDHVFLDYSAKNWAAHFHAAHIRNDMAITSLAVRICDTRLQSCLTWFRIYWTTTDMDFPENFTSLMIASYFGLETVVKLLLEKDGVDLNLRDDTYERSALSWAAKNGHEAVVKLLLNKRAKVDLKAIVKLGLKKGAKVDSTDKNSQTPLSYAAANGHEAVVKLLLEKGASLKSKDKDYGRTPLSWAALYGHEAVVKLLRRKGAKLETKDKEYDQAQLRLAASRGHEAVAKLLLEKGAEPETKDNYGRTPLSLAARYGHEAVVKLLLEKGAELETKDYIGRTPLLLAAEKGYKAVVRLLLTKDGINQNIENEDDQTMLSQAVANGLKLVIQLLFTKDDVDLNIKDEDGRTPLSWAAENGHEAVVKLLLEIGAELETKDTYNGRTPLSWAAENGHEAVVKLLMEKGAKKLQ